MKGIITFCDHPFPHTQRCNLSDSETSPKRESIWCKWLCQI